MSCYEESVPKGEQLMYKPKQPSPPQTQPVKREPSP